MKKLNFIIGILIGLLTFSCSSNNENKTINEPDSNAKLLKQITNSDGYWHKFFYNSQNQIELITQTSDQITLDSTYFYYKNGILSKTLQRIYVPVGGIVNVESIFNQFNSSVAQGNYKIFKEDGTIFQDKTFKYTFFKNLIKSITFYNLDGSKSSEKLFAHDAAGNLTNFTETWYNSDGTIQTNRQSIFSEWDSDGLKTQSLLYWDYRINNIPNMYLSNSNCLNKTENNQLYEYSFEYDSEGNVTKYTSINEQKYITLEYY